VFNRQHNEAEIILNILFHLMVVTIIVKMYEERINNYKEEDLG